MLNFFSSKSIHRDEPPKDISVAKDICQSVEESLLLRFDQIFVLQLLCKHYLDAKVILALLQVIDIAPILPYQMQLICK